MNASHLRVSLVLVLMVIVPACAAYESVELANEVTALRKNLPSERVRMNGFEKEPWKRGYATGHLNQDVVEYVHPPETVENWTELLTMRVDWKTSKPYVYDGGQTFSVVPDPLVVMQECKAAAEARCGGAVAFRKLDEDRSGGYPSVIFYVACGQYPSAAGLPQAEADVYRVFQGKYGLHVLIRARRASSLDETTLQEWTQYMKRFYLSDDSD